MTIVSKKVTDWGLIIMCVMKKSFELSKSTFSMAIFSGFNNFSCRITYYTFLLGY